MREDVLGGGVGCGVAGTRGLRWSGEMCCCRGMPFRSIIVIIIVVEEAHNILKQIKHLARSFHRLARQLPIPSSIGGIGQKGSRRLWRRPSSSCRCDARPSSSCW